MLQMLPVRFHYNEPRSEWKENDRYGIKLNKIILSGFFKNLIKKGEQRWR